MESNIDEVALNTLLANGVDAPTAYAASYETESQPMPAWIRCLGYIAAIAAMLFGHYLFS